MSTNSPSPRSYDWAPSEIAIEYAAFDLARAGQAHRNGAGWMIGNRYATQSEADAIEQYERRAAAAVAFFTTPRGGAS